MVKLAAVLLFVGIGDAYWALARTGEERGLAGRAIRESVESGRRMKNRKPAERDAWAMKFTKDKENKIRARLVTRAGDSITEPGTLRYEVANAVSGDTILLSAKLQGTPIVLTHGELVLNLDMTIRAAGDDPATISGGGTSRIFEIAAGANVELRGLNLIDGNGTANNPAGSGRADGLGGAILNNGTLRVTGCTFSGNSARSWGGGIANQAGTITVRDSSFCRNQADSGGGINNNGTMTLTDSTFSGNAATRGYGGGISSNTAAVSRCTFVNNSAGLAGGAMNFGGRFMITVSDCTMSGNTATDGGGIENGSGATTTIRGSIISDNTAAALGGGAANGNASGPGALTFIGCTFSGNSARVWGGGIANQAGTITVRDSSLCGNQAQSGGGINNNGTMTLTDRTFSGKSGL